MDLEALKKDLQRTQEQIYRLENINETTNIVLTVPDKDFLDSLYNNFKNFTNEERRNFIKTVSDNRNINPDKKLFYNFKTELKNDLTKRLKERYDQTLEKINEIAKEA
jgi:small-conductance mechanosensitive channel